MPSSDQSCVVTSVILRVHWPWEQVQGWPTESSHQHVGNLPQGKAEAQVGDFWDSACSCTLGKSLCVFLPLGHLWPQPKQQNSALPFPSQSLSSRCPLPDTRPWGPPGSCEEGFNLLRGSGARWGNSLHCHAPSTPMHLLFGAGSWGRLRTPCSPHIPHFPQDQSRVFQRRRDEP